MCDTAKNTDQELWRVRKGDYYADSLHVTASGKIGINCGGRVIVMPIREWHKLASENQGSEKTPTNKQRDSIKPCTCNPKPNAWSGSYHKCVACGGFDEFEERV